MGNVKNGSPVARREAPPALTLVVPPTACHFIQYTRSKAYIPSRLKGTFILLVSIPGHVPSDGGTRQQFASPHRSPIPGQPQDLRVRGTASHTLPVFDLFKYVGGFQCMCCPEDRLVWSGCALALAAMRGCRTSLGSRRRSLRPPSLARRQKTPHTRIHARCRTHARRRTHARCRTHARRDSPAHAPSRSLAPPVLSRLPCGEIESDNQDGSRRGVELPPEELRKGIPQVQGVLEPGRFDQEVRAQRVPSVL